MPEHQAPNEAQSGMKGKGWWAAGIFILALWALVCFVLSGLQEKLLFFPPASSKEADAWARKAGGEIHVLPDGSRFWIYDGKEEGARVCSHEEGRKRLAVFFGGNGQRASETVAWGRRLSGCAWAALDYPGFSGSIGAPGQKAMEQSADLMMERLRSMGWDTKSAVVLGQSMGTYLAARALAQGNGSLGILASPFDSVVRVAKEQYPWAPVEKLLRHPFRADVWAAKESAPALILLAQKDEVVGLEAGKRLAQAWKGPVSEKVLAGAKHDDWESLPEAWEEIRAFIKSH